MFNRRRRREEEAMLQELLHQAAHAWNPSPQELTELITEALPDPTPAEPTAEGSEGFLPPSMQVSGDRQFAGRMMLHPAQLTIDGTVRTCPVCGVDRDWLVLCVGPDIWLRCRSAHETQEPALNSAWYESISGPLQEVLASKDEGVTKEGFDGTFSGITFPM